MNKKIYYGVFISLWGIILILRTIGLIDISLQSFWPLFIIIPSLRIILYEKKNSYAYITLIAGLMILLVTNDIIDYEIMMALVKPFIVLTLGAFLILSGLEKIKKINKSKALSKGFFFSIIINV